MNDKEKKVFSVYDGQEDHTPPPEDNSQVLSPGRRSALVTYLAILFAVAFLFVAVAMAVESKRLKATNEALQDSSQKTSASLTGSINALQEENQQLIQSKDELTAQVADLEISLQTARQETEEQKQSFTDQLEQINGEKQALEAEKAELQAQIEALTKKAQDAITVSELLQSAVAANEDGDMTLLEEIMGKITPLQEYLSASEKEIFESLVID